MAWTTPQEVRDIWPDNAVEQAPADPKLTTYIAAIESQIAARYPTLQDRIDNATLSIDVVKLHTATWIIEYVMRGGNPYTQESMGYTGAASRSVTFESKWRKSLILSDSDLDVFMPKNQGKAFSVDMAPNLRTPETPDEIGWRTVAILM